MSEEKLHQGISRRSFLKTAAVTAGAAAAAGTTLTATAADTVSDTRAAEETTFRSQCRGNCGSRCPLKVTVREGRAVKVEAMQYPGEEHRRRLCVKGYSQPQRVYDPDRLKYPIRRVDGTERGAGQWERVEWDAAIGEIAAKMGAAMAEAGGTSLGFWSSYGSYGSLNGAMGGFMSIAYGRFLTATGAVIFGAGADTAQQHEQSTQLGISGNDFADARNSKTIFAWGGNPAEAYVHAWQYICDARENGAKLITIDPQFTASAMHSDLYVPIIPGTDGAMMLAMANYIIKNDLMDERYMKNNTCSPFLVKADGTYLRMSSFGVEPQPGPINPSTGYPTTIDPVVVWDLATGAHCQLDDAQDPALEGVFIIDGVEYKTTFTVVQEAIAEYTTAKAAQISGVPGETIEELARIYATQGPVFVMTFQGLGHHVNSHHNYKNLALLAALTGNAGKPGAAICGNPAPFTMVPYNTTAFMCGYPGSRICGMYIPQILKDKKFGATPIDLRVLWIHNGNVLSCESGRQELIEAVKQIDFVVCVDCNMNDSARYADIVLPIPHCFELEDLDPVGSTPFPAYYQKGLEPLYECKTDLEIMRMVADKLGMGQIYGMDDQDFLRSVYNSDTNKAVGMTYDDFASGKFVHNALTTPANLIPAYGPAESTRLKYYLEKPSARNSFGQAIADYEKVPYYEHANEAYMDNPLREKYPLLGCSEHSKYHVHSQLAYTPVIRELEPEPLLKMNASDAAARGIAQGDVVRAYNDHGFVVIKALVTEGIMPGVVSIPHGFQLEQFIDGHAQDLTNIAMNEFCSNSAFYDFLCQVEKYEGGVR